jgi:hypothetical protein
MFISSTLCECITDDKKECIQDEQKIFHQTLGHDSTYLNNENVYVNICLTWPHFGAMALSNFSMFEDKSLTYCRAFVVTNV